MCSRAQVPQLRSINVKYMNNLFIKVFKKRFSKGGKQNSTAGSKRSIRPFRDLRFPISPLYLYFHLCVCMINNECVSIHTPEKDGSESFYMRGSWQFTGLIHKYIIGLLSCVPWWWGWGQELHQLDKSFFCHLLSLMSKASTALKLSCSPVHSILWGMKAASLIHRFHHLRRVRLHEVYEWHAQKTSSFSVFL